MWFEQLTSVAKRCAAQTLEHVWGQGHRTAAMIAPVAVERLVPSGHARVLVVAPHPDDEAMGCAGSILLHVAAGDAVTIAIATDGRRSRAVPNADAMAARRRAEAVAAAQLMGVERLEWIGMHEGEWQVPTLQLALRSLIDEISPDIIYAPSLVDFHPEHLRVAHALALALEECAGHHGRLRVYQVQVPLSAQLVNLVANISSVNVACEAVLREYGSQAGSVNCTHRLRRYTALRYGASGPAEAFWEVSVQRYVELHRLTGEPWPLAFRGLRYFPLTDPFAYVVGRRQRRRIRDSHPDAPSMSR